MVFSGRMLVVAFIVFNSICASILATIKYDENPFQLFTEVREQG